MPDAEPLPEAALTILHTRMLNDYTGASYSLEEVAGMDPLLFEVLVAVKQGMNPKATEEKA